MYDKVFAGMLIQRKRLEARLTQEALAEQVGCSLRHIVNIERGAIGLSIESMLKLCDIFHMTPNDLLLKHDTSDNEGFDWLIHSLQAMDAENRKTALSIITPYIEAATREGK